jgi:hypothetical protein
MTRIVHFLAFLCCFLCLSTSAFAQITTVSGTVTDPNGLPWIGATLKAQLTSPGATVTISSSAQCAAGGFGSAPCKVPIQGTFGPVTLDSNGSFTLNLFDVTQVNPPGTQWVLSGSISPGIPPPQGFGPQQFSFTSTGTLISGASVNISSQLSAVAPALGRQSSVVGDPVSGLAASTPTPQNGSFLGLTGSPGTVGSLAVAHTTVANPSIAEVTGIVQSDNSVDNINNNLVGGYFSANARSVLSSSVFGGGVTGVTGYATSSHSAGNNGKVLGGFFVGQNTSSGTVSDLSGIAAVAEVSGSGLVQFASGIHIYAPVISGGTPPTNAAGLTINTISGAVNNYGIQIANHAQNATTWAIQTKTGKVEFGDNLNASGSVPTITGTGACATISTQSGGAWNFSFKCTGATGASTITITFVLPQTNGYHCEASDETTVADKPNQTSHTATTCVLTTTTTASNDTILVNAFGF